MCTLLPRLAFSSASPIVLIRDPLNLYLYSFFFPKHKHKSLSSPQWHLVTHSSHILYVAACIEYILFLQNLNLISVGHSHPENILCDQNPNLLSVGHSHMCQSSADHQMKINHYLEVKFKLISMFNL